MPKVTVYTVCRNYGRFLAQAIDSVLTQTLRDWELIVIDDGSTDSTGAVLDKYEGDPRIRILRQPPRGLPASCNTALSLATGDYVVRLDADDYFDENALLVLAGILDTHHDVALVCPDYFLVSGEGEVIGHVRKDRISDDAALLDLPAHGAGTMVRRDCLLGMGGYDEGVDCQDGYDLWLKMFDRFKMYNVNLPLFYYRRHAVSLTTDQARILRARRALKERYVRDRGVRVPSIVAVIPVRHTSSMGDGWALRPLAGEPLLTYTLREARACSLIARTVVVTEDAKVADFARQRGVDVIMRPPHLARANSPIEPTALYTIDRLREGGLDPEVICLLHANSPFRRADHITEALNTLLIFRPDSVISVCENTRLQYQHRVNGLEPIFARRELRLEREALYEENGALYVSWSTAITPASVVGKRVGHIVMTRESSVHLDSAFDWWMAEQLAAVRETPMSQGWDI